MARVCAAAVVGVEVVTIEIETVVQSGFSGLSILGLPSDVCRDLRERVRSALESAGLPLPARRVVVNLSPAAAIKSMRPPHSVLDFAVAASIELAFYEQEKEAPLKKEGVFFFGGELSLDGTLKPLGCALAFEKMLRHDPAAVLFVPTSTPLVASNGMRVLFFKSLQSWRATLHEKGCFEFQNQAICAAEKPTQHAPERFKVQNGVETEQVKSDQLAEFQATKTKAHHQRLSAMEKSLEPLQASVHVLAALLFAAAGRHHLLLAGEPGVGKTFAGHLLNELLPPLHIDEWIELRLLNPLWTSSQRPFCTPHHSVSSAALVGGANLQPGEVSLAHGGCLLLDELSEFARQSLEALREPLDTRSITVSRAQGRMRYPAGFLLCATTNPCPCGYLYSRKKACRCNPQLVQKYQQKLSGPLLDRFCMSVWVGTRAEIANHPLDPVTQALSGILEHKKFRVLLERVIDLQHLTFSNPSLPYAAHTTEQVVLSRPRLQALTEWAAGEHMSTRALQKATALATTIEALLEKELRSLSPQTFVEGVMAFRGLEKRIAIGKGAPSQNSTNC